jgi:hypothetical protein
MASKVMKKAWELFRKAGVKTMEAWSNALRTAWAIVKGVMKEVILPVLEGSEKQVAWAEEIRKTVAANKDRVVSLLNQIFEEKGNKLSLAKYAPEIAKTFADFVENENKASEWINTFKKARDFESVIECLGNLHCRGCNDRFVVMATNIAYKKGFC